MGSALARALANNKHRVTVWNRTSEKAKALVEVGVRAAANFNEAVQSSPLILVCLDSYDTSRSLFGAPDIARKFCLRVRFESHVERARRRTRIITDAA